MEHTTIEMSTQPLIFEKKQYESTRKENETQKAHRKNISKNRRANGDSLLILIPIGILSRKPPPLSTLVHRRWERFTFQIPDFFVAK